MKTDKKFWEELSKQNNFLKINHLLEYRLEVEKLSIVYVLESFFDYQGLFDQLGELTIERKFTNKDAGTLVYFQSLTSGYFINVSGEKFIQEYGIPNYCFKIIDLKDLIEKYQLFAENETIEHIDIEFIDQVLIIS